MEYYRANANLLCNSLTLCLVGMLVLCDLLNSCNSLGKEILKKNYITRSGSKLRAVYGYGAIGNVNELIVPFVTISSTTLNHCAK